MTLNTNKLVAFTILNFDNVCTPVSKSLVPPLGTVGGCN